MMRVRDSALDRATLTGAALAAVPPLLYVYMPRPPVPGAHLLVYPVLAGSLFLLGSMLAVRRSTADRRLLIVTALCLLLSVVAGASGLINSKHIRATAPLDLVRPAVLLIFFAYGYYLVCYRGEGEARRGLLVAALLILAGQAVIGALQLVGVSFDFMYTEEKFRPIGSLLRITGSLGNPNWFAWIVSQASIMILMLSSRPIRYLVLALGALLILLSGSRTLLILFPVMVAVGLVLSTPGRLRISRTALAYGFVIGLAFFVALAWYGDYFPYLAQLAGVAGSGSLASVGSVAARLSTWEQTYSVFDAEGASAWLVGLGSRESTRVLDNDFLYVLFRFGALGFAIHLVLILYLFWLFWSTRTSTISRVGLQYLCFALLQGTVRETLGGWMHPLLLLYFAGIAAGLKRQGVSRMLARGADIQRSSIRQWRHEPRMDPRYFATMKECKPRLERL